MHISCPNCKTRFNFDEARVGDQGVKLRCSKCQVVFKVMKRLVSTPSGNQFSGKAPDTPPVKVFVANESQPFCNAVRKLLSTEPFDVSLYNDGKSAMAAIEAEKPAVVLLDVALPSMYGFEICEAVRKIPDLASVKLILIASVYDKTRYKRNPESLYGADAYIEKHHIPDSLIPMIYRLLAEENPANEADIDSAPVTASPPEVPVSPLPGDEVELERARQLLKHDDERATVSSVSTVDQSEAHLKARRLARIIVSDILLYNQAKVEEGVKNGTFYSLMADDIREGRSLYQKRVAPEICSTTSYLDEAFENMIAAKRQEMKV